MTSSGKRLLRTWICHPLKDVEGINNRLNVVEEMLAHPGIMLLVAQYLHKLPDLERSLGRIRASLHSSVTLLLPMFGKKVLKQRVSLLYFYMEYFFFIIFFLYERNVKTAFCSLSFFSFLFSPFLPFLSIHYSSASIDCSLSFVVPSAARPGYTK